MFIKYFGFINVSFHLFARFLHLWKISSKKCLRWENKSNQICEIMYLLFKVNIEKAIVCSTRIYSVGWLWVEFSHIKLLGSTFMYFEISIEYKATLKTHLKFEIFFWKTHLKLSRDFFLTNSQRLPSGYKRKNFVDITIALIKAGKIISCWPSYENNQSRLKSIFKF